MVLLKAVGLFRVLYKHDLEPAQLNRSPPFLILIVTPVFFMLRHVSRPAAKMAYCVNVGIGSPHTAIHLSRTFYFMNLSPKAAASPSPSTTVYLL